jgi:beta-1,4-mannooligosaccharide/beta-1,4-mannosyl-N-acetylglucosamine phosphorylase
MLSVDSDSMITRYDANPVLRPEMVPYPSLLTFNAGVTKFQNRYVMVFRNDYGDPENREIKGTNLGLAFSDDGIHWKVQPDPFMELSDDDIRWINDPRLTVIDSRCYITYAIISHSGTRGGIAVTDDFENFEIIHTTLPDNRNLVLFPEKVNGRYVRLDRPFANYLRNEKDRFDIWTSSSYDFTHWGEHRLVLKSTDVPYCNNKIGPGTPPVKTPNGWLHIFHAVTVKPEEQKNGWEETWDKTYSAGVFLTDLNNPGKVRGVSKDPILIPQAVYENSGGFRNDVIFPTGAILEKGGELKIYYGAADTLVCLAVAQIDELVELCLT